MNKTAFMHIYYTQSGSELQDANHKRMYVNTVLAWRKLRWTNADS